MSELATAIWIKDWISLTGKRTRIGGVLLVTSIVFALFANATPSASAYKVPCDEDFGAIFLDLFSNSKPLPSGSCGEFIVPRDYSGGNAGREVLRFKRYLPRGRKPKGTVLFLAGGPGQPSVALGADTLIREAAPGYQAIEFNQRGTGETALRCPKLEQAFTNTFFVSPASIGNAFADCADTIGPNSRFYSSADSARDIDLLRKELGVEKIAIVGVSYGTYVAQVYARMFPNNVERLVLDSVVAADGIDPQSRSTLAATRRLMSKQCANGACAGVTSDFAGDIAKLQAKIGNGPLSGNYTNRVGKRASGKFAGPDTLGSIYTAGDFNPLIRTAMPAAVRAALRGDTAPLVRLQLAMDEGPFVRPAEFSPGLLAATVCSDTRFPWKSSDDPTQREAAWQAALSARPAADFAPFGVTGAANGFESLGCRRWPDTGGATTPTQPLPDVPVLLFEGSQDVRTPIEDGRAVAKLFRRSTLVEVPGMGHSVLGSLPCTESAMRRFMTNKPVGNPCKDGLGSILSSFERLVYTGPIKTSTDQFGSAGGARGKAGRTAAIVAATLRDVQTSIALSGGTARFRALRRGYGELGELFSRVKLRRYSYVSGVEISGDLHPKRGIIRISGSRAASGRLSIEKKRLRGRIGAQRVTLPRSVLPNATLNALFGFSARSHR